MNKFFNKFFKKVESNLDDDSNRIVELIHKGLLAEAEAGAKKLLVDYPEVHDGLERLAMVFEAKGDSKKAVEMYQKSLNFVNLNKKNYSGDFDNFVQFYKDKIKKLS
jgi:tetratricopeptide (TPR) repeat protein